MGPPYPGALTAGAGGPIAVTAARLHPREGYFIGLPGQVQDMDGNALTVMCGDGRCLDLTEWSGPAPRRHEMLGGARDGAA